MKQGNRWLGEQIRAARKAKGWSQTDLGKLVRRGQGWVALVETGKLTVREDLKKRVMDVLGLSIKKKRYLGSVPSAARRRQIKYFSLKEATPNVIEALIKQSPRYEVHEVRDLLYDVQGVIHQIPKCFRCAEGGHFKLKNIRGYFGRSSAGAKGLADNLYQRFRCGYTMRGDSHGIILATTSIKATALLERFGIGYLEYLKRNDGLCIANASKYDNGKVGTAEPGFLYMTFKIADQEEDWAKLLTPKQIADAIPQMLKIQGANQLGSRMELTDALSDTFQQANDPRNTGNLELKPIVRPAKLNRKCA